MPFKDNRHGNLISFFNFKRGLSLKWRITIYFDFQLDYVLITLNFVNFILIRPQRRHTEWSCPGVG